MEITKKGLRNILNSDIVRIWILVFMSFVSGYIILMAVVYLIYDEDLFSSFAKDFFSFFLIYVITISFLLVTIVIKLKLHKLNSLVIRFLLCICIPLLWGFLFVIVAGGDSVTIFLIKINSYFLDSFINYSASVIPIVLGLIFINPWRSILNFLVGVVYVAVFYFVLIIYQLILVGMIYDDWL